MLLVKMIRPPCPCLTICRAAIWLTRNDPNRFTPTTKFHSSSVMSTNGTFFSTPALEITMSRRPNLATVSATIFSTSARLDTSPATAMPVVPNDATSASASASALPWAR